MDLLSYSRKPYIAPFTQYNLMTEKWFGTKSFLKTLENRIQINSSLDKQTRIKSSRGQKLEILRDKFKFAADKLKNTKILYNKFRDYQDNLQTYRNFIEQSQQYTVLMNRSAIKIQKVFRGYLIRKLYENEILEFTRHHVNKGLHFIINNDFHLMFYVGKKPQQAAVIIQHFFRRCLFKKKIVRLKETYDKVQKIKIIKQAEKMRKYFAMISSQILRFEAMEFKIILNKLAKIKENLTIIKIKMFLRRRKLKLKTIKHRVKRYSKRYSQPSGTSYSPYTFIEKTQVQTIDNKVYSGNATDEAENPVPGVLKNKSIDKISITTEDMNIARQARAEKIKQGLVSYNVPIKKSSNFLPLFIDYDPDSRPQTTRSTTNRMNLANPLRIPPKPLAGNLSPRKSDFLSLRRRKNVKKYAADEIPPYTKDTKNSVLRYEETPSPSPEPIKYKKPGANKIMCTTFSFTQRTKSSEQVVSFRNIMPLTSRPATGPNAQRKKVKSMNYWSCVNIVEPGFQPPQLELNEIEVQNFRPFFIRIRPGLEKLKVNSLNRSMHN
ncbi:hypothetical protein SteCoe_6752 [Stentor coeruleus]|uniref:Uncharacterized protein n=1 Tax=Stentor coeruleus TaxID=5963 RepID=A0A1R2CP65_9CILI|nr:hypothetical protein SteCoe_6752 [Stentor coeruleus]